MLQLLLVLLISSPLLAPITAEASQDPSVSALAGTRTEVYVTNTEGLERRGRVRATGSDGVRLVFGGRETLIPWSEIAVVERRGDPVWDGALKGAAISAAIYGLIVLTADDHSSEGEAEFVAESVIVWAGVGALIDALHIGRSRVFVSPEVAYDRGRRSAGSRPAPGVVVGARVSF